MARAWINGAMREFNPLTGTYEGGPAAPPFRIAMHTMGMLTGEVTHHGYAGSFAGSFEDLWRTIYDDWRERVGHAPPVDFEDGKDESALRVKIQALVDRGATEGEREAARAALARLDARGA